MPKRDLRATASGMRRKAGYTARLDLFLSELDADDLEAVMDLLAGEPRLTHVSVARTLSIEFAVHPQIVGRAVTDDEVLRWRAKNAN